MFFALFFVLDKAIFAADLTLFPSDLILFFSRLILFVADLILFVADLILLSFLLALAFDGVDSDFFVILLQSGQILTSLRELTLLHTLSDVPEVDREINHGK